MKRTPFCNPLGKMHTDQTQPTSLTIMLATWKLWTPMLPYKFWELKIVWTPQYKRKVNWKLLYLVSNSNNLNGWFVCFTMCIRHDHSKHQEMTLKYDAYNRVLWWTWGLKMWSLKYCLKCLIYLLNHARVETWGKVLSVLCLSHYPNFYYTVAAWYVAYTISMCL